MASELCFLSQDHPRLTHHVGARKNHFRSLAKGNREVRNVCPEKRFWLAWTLELPRGRGPDTFEQPALRKKKTSESVTFDHVDFI